MSETDYNIVIECEDKSLGDEIIELLKNSDYKVYLNRSGDILGTPTKEYKVTDKEINEE